MPKQTNFLNLILPEKNEFVDSWNEPVNQNSEDLDNFLEDLHDSLVAVSSTSTWAALRGSLDSLAERLNVSINADGTIDIIATDHAPHTTEEKFRSFQDAPNGILGLETAVGSVFTALVEPGILTAEDVIAKLTHLPAERYGLSSGTLSLGAPADITVIDPNETWQVDATSFQSKSRNTPFHGWTFTGRPVLTVLGGRITHQHSTE